MASCLDSQPYPAAASIKMPQPLPSHDDINDFYLMAKNNPVTWIKAWDYTVNTAFTTSSSFTNEYLYSW